MSLRHCPGCDRTLDWQDEHYCSSCGEDLSVYCKCGQSGVGYNDDGEMKCEDCHFADLCEEQEQKAEAI